MYYLHDESGALRFRLLQPLDDAELRDLEGCWRTAESIRRGRPLIVDVSLLASLGEQTRSLLERMREAGANIVTRADAGRAAPPCRQSSLREAGSIGSRLRRLLCGC